MNELMSTFQAWISDVQHLIIWLSIASVLLFGVSIPEFKEHPWHRRIFLSFSRTMIFICIIGLSSFLIEYNYSIFTKINGPFVNNGSVSNVAWKEWQKIYGGHFTQENLNVQAFKQVEQTVAIESQGTSSKPRYMTIYVDEPVRQSSIEQFEGEVIITANYGNQEGETFNIFTLSAIYEYVLINDSTDTLRYEFRFPLSHETKQFHNLFVYLNDKEIQWTINEGTIYWERTIYPHQIIKVKVQYDSLGENTYVFRINETYEIKNFKLRLHLDTSNFCLITQPENSGIQLTQSMSNSEHVFQWSIDNAILAPELGFNLLQGWPYSPYHDMLITLPRTTNALIFFLVITTLIMIIYRVDVKLSTISLLALFFLIPSFLLMSGGILHLASITANKFALYQVMMLPILSLISVVLGWLTMDRIPNRGKIQILLYLLFFAGIYPIIGLLDEQKIKTAETIIQAVMIAYLFIITLINHLKQKEAQ